MATVTAPEIEVAGTGAPMLHINKQVTATFLIVSKC